MALTSGSVKIAILEALQRAGESGVSFGTLCTTAIAHGGRNLKPSEIREYLEGKGLHGVLEKKDHQGKEIWYVVRGADLRVVKVLADLRPNHSFIAGHAGLAVRDD